MTPVYTNRSAILGGPPDSPEMYRYWLERQWADPPDGPRTLGILGYNPSTADGLKDDQTIRKEVKFARRWGYDRLIKANIYAYRSTDWRILATVDDPIGPRNPEWLTRLFEMAEIVVCAWGTMPLISNHAKSLAIWAMGHPKSRCLGLNQNGSPKHTLYLPDITPLQEIR